MSVPVVERIAKHLRASFMLHEVMIQNHNIESLDIHVQYNCTRQQTHMHAQCSKPISTKLFFCPSRLVRLQYVSQGRRKQLRIRGADRVALRAQKNFLINIHEEGFFTLRLVFADSACSSSLSFYC